MRQASEDLELDKKTEIYMCIRKECPHRHIVTVTFGIIKMSMNEFVFVGYFFFFFLHLVNF